MNKILRTFLPVDFCGIIFFLLTAGVARGQPSVVSVTSTGNQVRVVFSLAVEPASATNLASYAISNWYGSVPVTEAVLGSDSQSVQLTAAGQLPFMAHWLTVQGITDTLSGSNLVSSTTAYTNVAFTTGYIESDFYTGIAGTTIASLTNSVNFPNRPNRITYCPDSYWFDSTIGNNYGNRMFGLLTPEVSGPYQFVIYSLGTSQFSLSTNEDPAFCRVVANTTGGNYSFSAPIPLRGGQKYYFEALTKEGSSAGDFVELLWTIPGFTNSLMLLPMQDVGNYLCPVGATVRITQQPADTSVYVQRTATFTVTAAGSSKNTACTNYQWQLNGQDIPGATSSSYTTPLLYENDSGSSYRVLVVVPGAAQFSSNAVVTVTRDLEPPSVVQVLSLGLDTLQLVFSEPIDSQGATDLANYAFSDGPLLGATLDTAHLTVTLKTLPLVYDRDYSLQINGVRDQAYIPNTIPTNTVVHFTLTRPVSDDLGNASLATTTTVLGNGTDITASGRDIGGIADQFNFNDQLVSGDFDVKLKLTGLSAPDLWAKAGLMARESKAPGARFAAALATPSMNGLFFEYRDSTNGPSSSTGNLAANFPDTWLRLQRSGDVFVGYGSYDGQTWAELGSTYLVMSNLVYLGLATASHDSNQVASAQFRGFGPVAPDVVVGPVDSGHEPLGPSSRKTPIAISEIMYKPAPRPDGNNLEFIELYNSNPWFHDLSGYQVTGPNLSYTIPEGTILPGGGLLVIAASPQSLQDVYGLTNVLGPYTGSLKKAGPLRLLDEHGAVLLAVPYSNLNPWPVAADGTGHSLVLANPTYGEEDPRAWAISDRVGGSPGTMESFRPNPLRHVLINEWLAHSEDPGVPDFIELYNHDNQANDLSGCILSDDPVVPKFIFPVGTTIPARGFLAVDRTQLGFGLKASGETLYFMQADRTRVLDAVQFEGQANGVSCGRWPDGADSFYPLARRTPGSSNSPILVGDIVINEIMYHPISGNDDDQYVELFNQGTNVVDLGNWQLSAGVSFTIPSNTVVEPGGYMVLARNRTNLFAHYSNLYPGNTVGDYAGKLSHEGERLALLMPQAWNGTNTIWVVEDEVTYGTGGRWGQWSGGGGSSLELIDARANHRLAANWADSDETQKAAWVNIEATGTLDNGRNFDPSIDCAQIGLLDVGECLVDNIEVQAGTGGANYVLNSDFEKGLANWSLQGCMVRSSLENSGYLSQHSLHIRCSSHIWTGVNSCQVALSANGLASGQQATLRFKARWLRGWPEILLRLHGNWLEAVGTMPVPVNLGTPGAPNSRRVLNAGPAIYEVTHTPALPAGWESAVVSARVHDPDGLQSLTLNYRLDPQTDYTSVPMKDDGTGGDALAGDGVYSATIPSSYSGTLAAFYISATDRRGSSTRFPALRNDNAPVPECMVRFGDETPGGSFGVYHLWLTQTNLDRWSNLPNLSNEMHDGTLVNGRRIIYNMQGRFAGSPYHQEFYSPEYSQCHYKWVFPDDDKFLGATSFNKIHAPGNGPGDDQSLQREQTAYTFMRALGVPWLNRRYVALYVNGYRNLQLMEDTQCPDADMVKEYFPNDSGGYLYKMQPWFEFPAASYGSYISFNNNAWCTILPYLTTGGVKKTARYRYTFELRRSPDSFNNFTNVFALIDAASPPSSLPNYTATLENIADMENWMRVFAANHAAGNWDSFGSQNGQNLYGYIGTQGTRYSLMMFDFNIVLGNSSSWNPGQNLFLVNPADGNESKMIGNITFRRMYLRAMQELVDGPLTVAKIAPLIDAKYNSFVANGLSVENTTSIKNWLNSARVNIAAQIPSATFSVSPSILVAGNVAYVSGTAPVNIKTVWINGVEWPISWKSLTGWTVTVPLKPGYNALSATGVDIHHQPVAGATETVGVTYNGGAESPAGQVVFSEIMYHPLAPNAQYLELQNNSADLSFDLSGWRIPELAYTFPNGSLLGPRKPLLLVGNRAAAMGAYGAIPIFDAFGTPLPQGGTLTLVQPGNGGGADTVVAEVQYEAGAPWPSAADGLGSSLQLLDSLQDDWRVANWAASFPPRSLSPGVANPVSAVLPAFPPLWLNELQADNLTGATNSAGQHVPWVEIYNPGTNPASLDGLFLALDYTNLAQWAFPTGALIQPGQFKVIFADAQTNLTTPREWHTGFQLPSGSGSLALSQIDTNGQLRVLDYLNYTNLGLNHTYGSAPDGQSFKRQEFFYATPGGSNNVRTPLPVAINEWMAGNTVTLRDPVTGKYDDWFELYNYGDSPVDLAGYYLSHSLTNQFEFQIPAGYAIASHGFLLVWADKRLTNDTPELHVNFKLSKTGTAIGLFASNGIPVDVVAFGPQTSDISMGRYPDGTGAVFVLPQPTPRAANARPNSAPDLSRPADRLVYLGQTLSFSCQATDPDVPAQALTFSLEPGAPLNAGLTSSGAFSWAPNAAQSPSTNPITIRVTDNGLPPLSREQTFLVTVALPPQLSLTSLNENRYVFAWPTAAQQAYQLEYKDDLARGDWAPLGNSIVGSGTTLALTNDLNLTTQRFFRLRTLP